MARRDQQIDASNFVYSIDRKIAPFLKITASKRAPHGSEYANRRKKGVRIPPVRGKQWLASMESFVNFRAKKARKRLMPLAFRQWHQPFWFYGDPAGIRTPDTLLKRQVLCLLSYWVILNWSADCGEAALAGMAGLEPTISESKSGVLPLHYIPPSTCAERPALPTSRISGVGDGARTHDTRNHNPVLIPTELHPPFMEPCPGTPGGTRTPGLLLRRQLLYPAELLALI